MDHCSASSPERRAGVTGQTRPRELICVGRPPEPAGGDASPHTSCDNAHAVEMAREGVPLVVIQRRLGHSNVGVTSIYVQGIDNAEIIDTVHHADGPVNALLRR